MVWAVLAVQAACFAAWTILMFRMLFDLVARARAQTGQSFPGPAMFLRMLGQWWRDPARGRARLWLVLLTALLFGLAAVSGSLLPRLA